MMFICTSAIMTNETNGNHQLMMKKTEVQSVFDGTLLAVRVLQS